MEKLTYLLGDAGPGEIPNGRGDLREKIFAAQGALESAGATQITRCVADVDDPKLDQIAQMNASGLIDGQISLWVETIDRREEIDAVVSELASRWAGYLVTESILREYPEKTWAAGSASPGIAIFTTFPKPAELDPETFYARWHGSHGPLSLELHPLTRYVRNSVFRPLTPNAPLLHAIVSESVASCAVAADVDQFYSGRENQKRIVKDLLSFADVATMSSVVMREYIL